MADRQHEGGSQAPGTKKNVEPQKNAAKKAGVSTQRITQNMGRRASKSVSSLIFLFFLLLSSLIYVFLIFRDNRSFAVILEEIDTKTALGGQHSVAEFTLFQDAAKKADSERDYLRIFKRIYQIKSNQLRSRYMLEISEQAVAKFSVSEDLWAYRISALLDAGLFAQAISVSVNLKSPNYLPLRGEIFIRSLSEARENDEELSIDELVNASPYSAAIYVSLARLFREPRFAWNAALLYMLRGNTEKALALVRELQNEDWLNALAAGLIAYDNQDWKLASKFLERELRQKSQSQMLDIEILQYLGDSYAYLEEYEKVVEILGGEWQNEAHNVSSWKLYYNLASAYEKLGESDRAFALLRESLEMFPYVSDILLLLNIVAPPEEREYARNILHEFVATSTDEDPYLFLASLIFADVKMDRRKFEGRIWQLFNDFPENEHILRYALWYKLGLGHTTDVNLILERYQNLGNLVEKGRATAQDLPIWMLEYAAINALLQRDMATAQEIFEFIEKKDWQGYYNMANMYVYQADFAQAVKMLREALQLAENERQKVDIYYRMIVIGRRNATELFVFRR